MSGYGSFGQQPGMQGQPLGWRNRSPMGGAQPIDRIGSNGVFAPRTGGLEPLPNQMAPTVGPNGQPIANAGAGFGNGLQPSGFNYNPGQMMYLNEMTGQMGLRSNPVGQTPPMGRMAPQRGLLEQMPGRALNPWAGPADYYQQGGPDMGGGGGGY